MLIGARFKLLVLGLALTPALAHAAFDVKAMALTAGRHTSRTLIGAGMRFATEMFVEKYFSGGGYSSNEKAQNEIVLFTGALSTYLLPVKINKLTKLGDDNRTGTIAYAAGYMLLPAAFQKLEELESWYKARARRLEREKEEARARRRERNQRPLDEPLFERDDRDAETDDEE